MIFNKHIFPEGDVRAGDLVEILAVETGPNGKAHGTSQDAAAEGAGHKKVGQINGPDDARRRKDNAGRRGSYFDDGHVKWRRQSMSLQRRYLFLVDGKSSEHKIKQSNLQVRADDANYTNRLDISFVLTPNVFGRYPLLPT